VTETVQERIKNYLEDAIGAERNLEDALHAFGKTGRQETVKRLLNEAGVKARSHYQQLTEVLKRRGGSPSAAKSAMAHMLAFAPLVAQVGHEPEEKNTQHLIVTFGAAGAERAMYESLAQAAEEAGDTEVATLAQQLESEETDDARRVWPLLRTSARDALRATLANGKSVGDVLRDYLEDLIAAEKSFETQLNGFSREGDYLPAQTTFAEHARETRRQYERLTEHLQVLGGSTSFAKGMLAKIFAVAPKAAQIGHDPGERLAQNLIIAHAVECAEMAMYEVFSTVAADTGHGDLEALADEIQGEERATAKKVWSMVGPCARRAIHQVLLRKAS
jgi:ferritin-like metal-binding protein YciE